MPTKLKITAIAAAGLILLSVGYLYITRDSAVVFRYGDSESKQNAFIIQNPFRERGPEDEAEKVFQGLKTGNCEQVLALPGLHAETIGPTCEREAAYPIQSWSLVDRTDIGKQSIFVYRLRRSDGDRLAWIDVEKVKEDQWRVLSYHTY